MELNSEDKENKVEIEESLEITQRQRTFLALSDFLIIVMIIVDLLYIGELLSIDPGNMMMINVVSVAIAFVGYQLKKRVRKKNRRKKKEMADSKPQ
jgi:membrane-anchored glycerophosphoryl diester phosphodiesterase (GDPDase)